MAGPLLLGVNLAGAEFGSNVPGVFGTDYRSMPWSSAGSTTFDVLSSYVRDADAFTDHAGAGLL
jgi:hypothetical protein